MDIILHKLASIDKRQPVVDTLPGLGDTVVGFELNLPVFQPEPEALNKNIILPSSLSVHTEFDAIVLKHIRDIFTGKHRTLVAIEHLRCAIAS